MTRQFLVLFYSVKIGIQMIYDKKITVRKHSLFMSTYMNIHKYVLNI